MSSIKKHYSLTMSWLGVCAYLLLAIAKASVYNAAFQKRH
jgi:hypothetical protein